MNWYEVRALFPEQWVRLIPMDPFARGVSGKVYVDDVAIVEIPEEVAEAEVSVSRKHGYLTLLYHTREREIILEPGILPTEMVEIHGLIDLIYEEAYAVGLLKAGFSEKWVGHRMHFSLESIQQLKKEKIIDPDIQLTDERSDG